MDTYTINSISASGVVNVTFAVSGYGSKTLNLGNLPLGTPTSGTGLQALTSALNDMLLAYKEGLAIEKAKANITVDPTITAAIGQAQTLSA